MPIRITQRLFITCCMLMLAHAVAAQRVAAPTRAADEWASYGRDPGGARHSPLAQVTRENVGRLREAWRFSTGEADSSFATGRRTSFEATPLVIGGVMYFSTPLGRVFALDAATGRERWRFNAGVPHAAKFGDFTNRGLSYWVDSSAAPRSRCRERIVLPTIDARLVALDAGDGGTCNNFGDGGTIDLRRGLRNAPREFEEYELTSPPAVVSGMLVVGSAIADNGATVMASGEVRGYDARTGALRWRFDPVPRDSTDPAWSTWRGTTAHRTGAANVWSVIVADARRGLVFVPTSSPSPDYFGGERLGDNRYANSVVALDARTGRVVWNFQTVHHDLWDYDNASPPALVTLQFGGRSVDAVLQATKTGMLFVLDRATGKPLLPVEERPVPASTVPGEVASPTQPFSIVLSPHRLDAASAFGADSADRATCRATIAALRNEGIFTPPSLEGTLAMPSNIGGAHWGGVAFDAARQLAIVPVNTVAAVVQLIPRAEAGSKGEAEGWEYASMRGTPYVMRRRILISPKGVPCSPPPFGELVAVHVPTGTIAWRIPLGSAGPVAPAGAGAAAPQGGRASTWQQAFGARGPDPVDVARPVELGSPNLGGAIVTAGGLTFIGATVDRMIRAFDTETGRELWRAPLPASGKATPMTYAVNGRQYVAIAAGGDGGGFFGRGDEVVVFALDGRRGR